MAWSLTIFSSIALEGLWTDKISEGFLMRRWGKKRRVMRHYDASALVYDGRYSSVQGDKIKAALKNLDLKEFDYVLDAGCGTGLLFDYIIDRALSVVGIDVSRKSLLQAKARTRDLVKTHLVWADVDNMPLKSGVLDAVFAFTLLQNMPNPAETLSEIVRVARDDAVIVVTGLKKVLGLKYFRSLLSCAGLEIIAIEGDGLECYVAVCRKAHVRRVPH